MPLPSNENSFENEIFLKFRIQVKRRKENSLKKWIVPA